MKGWNDKPSIEDGIRRLPGKKPPADLRKKIMLALPEYREPWFRRVLRWIDTGPLLYRAAGAIASIALTFYGGMQYDRFFPGSFEAANESIAVKGNMNDEALFYLGRSLLAAGQSTEALDAFSQAEILRPDNPQYALWKGAAYQAIGAVEEERQTYRQLIDKRPDLLPARLNLANNLLQDGQASQAQQLYEQILESDPTERTALYNRAIALRLQGKPEEEAGAWKIYLDYHRAGISASRAMQHLYELGDYSYRNYQLGEKSVILNQDRLLNPQGRERAKEIDYLARQLNKRSLGDLNIVVFVQDDAQQAKSIAHSLRSAIAERTDGLENDSIGVSWFDEAEPIETLDKDKINLSKGVLIFSAPTNNPNMEKRI